MAFHFKRTEPPDEAVRRVCRERIGEALKCLRQSRRPAAVHGVRKEIKKLRALFRLVRREIDAGDYRKGTKSLREAARRLAAPRDARVMLKAFEKLAGRHMKRFPGIRAVLEKHARRKAKQFQRDDLVPLAGRLLRRTRRRVEALEIRGTGWAVIEPALRESYRRGRAARERAARNPSPENFHDWRKQVKDLWHYFRLLQPAWPAEIRALTEDLEILGEYLGDDHDLALLQGFVTRHAGGRARETGALDRLIHLRQRRLRAAALRLGSRLYDQTPARMCRRLGGHWNEWRGGVR